MEDRKRRVPLKKVIGCIGIPVLFLLALCCGPRACDFLHEQSVKSEFRAHREYYENLVRQIDRETPDNERRMYILPVDRYSGTLKRFVVGESDESFYDAIMSGRAVTADKWRGVLTVKFALRIVESLILVFPSECGVAFCSSGTPVEEAEESLMKFEDRWWLRWRFLGK